MTREIKIGCSIGAMAGITPLLVSLISVDVGLIVEAFVPAIVIGYLLKAFGLMVLGAFVVFVNSESDYKKAFQLGLMAPALVVGTINANNFRDAKQEMIELEAEFGTHTPISISPEHGAAEIIGDILSSLIGNAYADNENMLIGKHENPSTSKLIWYGISGKVSDGWFVIVGKHENKSDAYTQVMQLKDSGYSARVVQDKKHEEGYVVAIGSYLNLKDAKVLHKKAIRDGLSRHPYLWKWK
ncbi:MAG: SPOR domain-containing protein [Candidatus Thiodiazotropha sp. 6PLUC2]